MVGWLVPEVGRGRLRLEQIQVRGMPLLRAGVPMGWSTRGGLRRLRRAARGLREAGVRRILVPEGFAGWPQVVEEGLFPVDPVPLCRVLAPRLALAMLESRGVEPGRAAVLLRGRRVDRALFETAHTLCPRVRTLALAVPDGGAELCVLLRQEYGAAVPETLGGMRADVAVDFAPVLPDMPGNLVLCPPVPCLSGLELRARSAELPGVESLPVLALLWEEGRLPLGEIEIFTTRQGQISLTDEGKIPIISN